jgi:hypothetical protein
MDVSLNVAKAALKGLPVVKGVWFADGVSRR